MCTFCRIFPHVTFIQFAENFAQSLEIKEPEEDIILSLPPAHPSSDFTSDLHSHTSSEVEVQVLESGTVGLTSRPATIPLLQRGKGKQATGNQSRPIQSMRNRML